MKLAKRIISELKSNLSPVSDNPNATLNNALRLLAKWRSVLIQNTLLEKEGTYVLQGPLKGLDFIEQSSEGCHIAKLIGCYEQPLQSHISTALTKNYSKIINIGCAEGYYAVGFAMVMSTIKSLAFDTDPKAQEACKKLALKNGVGDRVEVGGIFSAEDFAKYADDFVLIFCDIEGAEDELLNPKNSPALASMDIIVESHECIRSGITKRLMERFKSTHNIQLIEDDGSRELIDPPTWFTKLSHLDQLLSTWEWRSGPTPWLVMHSKALTGSH
ncbi:MAG: hypothetical protein P8N61_10055 [Porticoccaceae bacterium]|nr:hypothetical protein [Porticoccaceae bacterium]